MSRSSIILVVVLLLIIFFVGFVFLNSAYETHGELPYRAVSQQIIINAPVEAVFVYLGKSSNASEWSVYVDHITPLNSDSVADGSVGCRRRCFTDSLETGATWDETILFVQPNTKRQLNIYRMVDFYLSSDCLLTEQIYRSVDKNSCAVTLTLFLNENAGFADKLKLHLVSPEVSRIFKENLQNIKHHCERRFSI